MQAQTGVPLFVVFGVLLTGLIFHSSAVVAEAGSKEGAQAAMSCSSHWPSPGTSYSSETAFSRMSVNHHGDASISLAQEANGIAESVLRFRSESEEARSILDSTWSAGEVEIEIERWSLSGTTLAHIKPLSNELPSFIVSTLSPECREDFIRSNGFVEVAIVDAAAIARVKLQSNRRASLREALDLFSDAPLITKPDAASSNSRNPVGCPAGGTGAIACGWSAGGTGPGSCSITCVPPAYACCGQRSRNDCSCMVIGGDDK